MKVTAFAPASSTPGSRASARGPSGDDGAHLAFLLPQQLHWYLHPYDGEQLDRHGLLDCIECGCCDYVCPSQIPLAERFRETKPLLIRERGSGTRARPTLVSVVEKG